MNTSEKEAVADVYSADLGVPGSSSEHTGAVFVFVIEADAQPDVLARVASVFNLANRPPLAATLRQGSLEQVHIVIDMAQITPSVADSIRRKLLQLTCVTAVEMMIRTAA
jgi:hypothetical protein